MAGSWSCRWAPASLRLRRSSTPWSPASGASSVGSTTRAPRPSSTASARPALTSSTSMPPTSGSRTTSSRVKGDEASVVDSTKENLNRLVDVGKGLLKKPVCKVNIETGRNEADANRGTNEDELIRFAKMLVQERRARMQKKGNNTP
ncbi:hypothetical protein U9M48_018271 [Paspalum notatum var. saurae]|uniref:Uncharacterized protein n=1 Tax=Paspalum notatum var. saurae TaxID=547442 RepID=A0AAQ3TD50_PASNO